MRIPASCPRSVLPARPPSLHLFRCSSPTRLREVWRSLVMWVEVVRGCVVCRHPARGSVPGSSAGCIAPSVRQNAWGGDAGQTPHSKVNQVRISIRTYCDRSCIRMRTCMGWEPHLASCTWLFMCNKRFNRGHTTPPTQRLPVLQNSSLHKNSSAPLGVQGGSGGCIGRCRNPVRHRDAPALPRQEPEEAAHEAPGAAASARQHAHDCVPQRHLHP